MIDFVASQLHYADWLAPVWHALPEPARGCFYAATREVAHYLASELGIAPTLGSARDRELRPLLTAGFHDARVAHPLRQVAYLEHGAGQTYGGDPAAAAHASYAGGRERERIGLFLVPHEESARREQDAYPDAAVRIVGSPLLDSFPPVVRPHGLVVALCWHWNLRLCPETTWAWPEWRQRILDELRDDPEVTLLGSGHPRAWGELERWYGREAIEPVPRLRDILERADVLCADNTSAMWLGMAAGVGCVALNSRRYRPAVEHGLRFWARCPQPALWPDAPPGALAHAVRVAAEPGHRAQQMADVADLFPSWTRGISAELAAKATLEWAQSARVGA